MRFLSTKIENKMEVLIQKIINVGKHLFYYNINNINYVTSIEYKLSVLAEVVVEEKNRLDAVVPYVYV